MASDRVLEGPTIALCGDLQTLVAVATRAAEEDQSDDSARPPKKKRVYKKRKSTHTVRKEERLALETEIQELQSKLDTLKLRVLIQNGEEDASLNKQTMHNSALRDAVLEHQLVAAKAQAMLTNCTQHQSYKIRPTESYIYLPTNQTHRCKTLRNLRPSKLQYARQFIQQRSVGLHPTAEYFNEERYETPEGDFCNVRFDRTCLHGVRGGVRAVFEALKLAIFNAEIVLSEASGNITVREDDNMDDIDDFSQMSLVTQSTLGLLVENNLVHFSELVFGDKDSDTYAVAAVDYVDKDDRFPYRPTECIRRDAVSTVLLTSCKDKRKEIDVDDLCGHTSSEEESNDSVVVLTRWTFTRICRTDFYAPTQTLRDMRDRSGQVADTILSCVRETLNLPTTT
ncbi:hypothetical protein PPTG_17027 [Phytophthora nicotianae INRA-310]|uniref:Uncharacterized protein n=1 Tax=Phytophthora nicotianae (strain INRA-310) TaxID=761204 RepID=W2PLQ7_PHYN3|nr:hypothetical protein PPTG_17027 [Phytophthora nicotianae INRA-310]ETN01566.1 hypothetical protein PPTG_17027 [Phytophthora nicotianae INRA-310]